MRTRQIISFLVAAIGTTAAILLESVVTPGRWEEKWHLVTSIAALNVIRLYAFYEASVMRELSVEKAKRAFKLSISLSIGFACYGIYLKVTEVEFGWHALGLFLLLQFGLAVVEWMFSERMGNYVETEFGKQLDEQKQLFEELLAKKDKQSTTVKELFEKQLSDFSKQSAEKEELLIKQFSELQGQFSELSAENAELLVKIEQQSSQLLSQNHEQSLNSRIIQLAGRLLPATQSHKLVLCTNCAEPCHIHNSKLSKHTGADGDPVTCSNCGAEFQVRNYPAQMAS